MKAAASRTAHLSEISAIGRAKLATRLVDRRYIETSGCWTLRGHRLHSGHLQLVLGSPSRPPYLRVRAHVFAWELLHNQDVPADCVVMHSCDNAACVNPSHLTVGTQAENVRDSVLRGRHGAWHRTGVRVDGRLSRKQPASAMDRVFERVPSVQLQIRGEVS